jgi:hypothetical protein
MSRPDSYILKLAKIESNLCIQIMHCKKYLQLLNDIKLDDSYETDATTLEKSNIDLLITLIGGGLQTLEGIQW